MRRAILSVLVAVWVLALVTGIEAQFTCVNGVCRIAGFSILNGGTIAPVSGTFNLGSVNVTVGTTGIITSHTSASFADTVAFLSSNVQQHFDGGAIPCWNSASGGTVTVASPGTCDTGFARNAAAVVEVNTGTAGTFGALKTARYDVIGTVAVAVANVGANSCGTSAATIAGNDNIGAFTVGATAGTQCRIAFVVASPTRRHCTFDDETTTIAIRSTYVDTTHTDALGAFVAGDVVSYHCFSR